MKLEMTQVKDSITIPEIIVPTYGSDGAAAFDLRADLVGRDIKVKWDGGNYIVEDCSGTFTLEPQARALIPTGWIFDIPEGYQMNIYSRSGHTWKHGVIVLNAPAIIDHDYKDETFVVLYNSSDKPFTIKQGDNEPFTIKHGDRIAQAQLNVVNRVELGSLGTRTGGFGSTNV